MLKKIYYILIITSQLVLTSCKEEDLYLSKDKFPAFCEGNLLFYADDEGHTDTFQVSKLSTYMLYSNDYHRNLQMLRYNIDKISKQSDTSFFTHLAFITGVEHGTTLNITSAQGKIYSLFYYDADTLYKSKSIKGNNYSSVYFYSLKKLNLEYQNLYFNYQFGLLSIEVNGHLIYLAESSL
jgi:hypothetical protein